MKRRFLPAVAVLAIVAGLVVTTATAAPSKSGSASTTVKTGGTFIYELSTDVDYTDPQLSYYNPSWQLEYATACKLFNWPDKEGAAGGVVTPEVSAGLPVISKDGKTYTFTIKPGFKFSNGQAVTAQSFKSAMERLANPKMASQGAPFLDIVAGSQAVIDGKASAISGVTANGNKLSVKLTRAAPDFLARLTMPFFQAIDTNLAKQIDPNGIDTYASCGPYYFANRTVNRSITLKRNTFYKGSRPHNVDVIQVNVGNSLEVMYQNTLEGKTDYPANGIPPAEWSNVAKKFGINKSQFQIRPSQVIDYVAMNRDRALFKNNPKLAKAVNWAFDRQAYTAQRGYLAGKRTDQILPPGMAGYKDYQLYPLAQNQKTVDTAKKLAAGNLRGGKAVLWTSNRGAAPLQGQVVQFNLKQIGIDADVKLFPRAQQFTTAQTRDQASYDIDLEAWGADYNDPYDWINILLDGTKIGPSGNNNYSYYNNPKFNKQMQAASLLVGDARGKAYQVLDRAMMVQDPPWAPSNYRNDRVLLSARVDPKCVVINEAVSNGPDLAAACLK